MEPKIPVPNTSYEIGASNPQVLPPHPEVLSVPRVETTSERPAQQEQQPAGPVQAMPGLPAVAAQQPAQVQSIPVLNPIPVTNTNPAVASDDEVIEKEWVDKAKMLIAQTKDDPYTQEKEVSKLQADYLKKRYGKEVKLASE